MSQQGVFTDYFHEVESWCESVLHVLDSRAMEVYDVHMLAYKIQTLLDRMKEHEYDTDAEFMYEISDDVEHIQHHLQEVFVQGEEEYELCERGDSERAVPIGGHTLPPLPYPYNALEPYISREIMMLHHDKHHRSYVEGLNKAEKMMEEARKTNQFDLIKHWEREAAFHGSGHYLHTIFWNNMKKVEAEVQEGLFHTGLNKILEVSYVFKNILQKQLLKWKDQAGQFSFGCHDLEG